MQVTFIPLLLDKNNLRLRYSRGITTTITRLTADMNQLFIINDIILK